MSEWQPIEIAPRDKKILAGYFNQLEKWRTILARYYSRGTLLASEDCDDADEEGYAPEEWYEESDSHETLLPCACVPTHWMPLPEPPNA